MDFCWFTFPGKDKSPEATLKTLAKAASVSGAFMHAMGKSARQCLRAANEGCTAAARCLALLHWLLPYTCVINLLSTRKHETYIANCELAASQLVGGPKP